MPVRIDITEVPVGSSNLVLGHKPYKTGKKKSANSHKIVLRTYVNRPVRVCFRSEDGRPVLVYFASPVNPTGDPLVAFVQIAAAGPGPFRDFILMLDDGAWPLNAMGTPGPADLKMAVSIFNASRACNFEDETGEVSHVDDIIIDGG